MNPRILLSHCHALRIVPSVIVRKLVVIDCHQMMMVTEIVLMVITEIVTAVDVVDVVDLNRDGDGNASPLRMMIPRMMVMTVTGLVVVVHRNLTGQSR